MGFRYVRYTRSKDNTTVFATALLSQPGTPKGGPTELGETLRIRCVDPVPGSDITMLGSDSKLAWAQGADGVTTIQIPAGATTGMKGPGFSFKITGKPADQC